MPEKTISYKTISIAFYNVENLFDTINNPETYDDDYTAEGRLSWTNKKFNKKIRNLGAIISQIGKAETGFPPLLIGLAEIENETVLEALINSKGLKDLNYGFVHFDSKDERGMDTALLYRKDYFNILTKKIHPVQFIDEYGNIDYTRDVLEVSGLVFGKKLSLLINHWPSRRAGVALTEPTRMTVSELNKQIINTIRDEQPDAKIIVMGDFNDDPESISVKNLVSSAMYNPMELLLTRESGSLTHKGNWNLFDQIILSMNFLQQYGNDFRFEEAKIFNLKSVQVFEGIYAGHPFRTFAGPNYLGGISDHFPVFSIFKINI